VGDIGSEWAFSFSVLVFFCCVATRYSKVTRVLVEGKYLIAGIRKIGGKKSVRI